MPTCARRVMEFDALNQTSRTRRCEQDCVHLSLGWRPGETPTRQQMEEAARDALKTLGMENAKAHLRRPQRRGIRPRSYRRLEDQSRDRPRLRPRAQQAARFPIWARDYEREHGGVVSLRRQDANELRAAIRDPRRRRRARGDDEAAIDLHAEPAASRARKRNHPAWPARRRPAGDERLLARFESAVLAHPELVRLSTTPDGEITRYTTRTVLRSRVACVARGRRDWQARAA